MILPAYNHKHISEIPGKKIGVRLKTTREGTVIELWSFNLDRPIKNGKLAMINKNGELVLFKNTNDKHVLRNNEDGDGTIYLDFG